MTERNNQMSKTIIKYFDADRKEVPIDKATEWVELTVDDKGDVIGSRWGYIVRDNEASEKENGEPNVNK